MDHAAKASAAVLIRSAATRAHLLEACLRSVGFVVAVQAVGCGPNVLTVGHEIAEHRDTGGMGTGGHLIAESGAGDASGDASPSDGSDAAQERVVDDGASDA